MNTSLVLARQVVMPPDTFSTVLVLKIATPSLEFSWVFLGKAGAFQVRLAYCNNGLPAAASFLFNSLIFAFSLAGST